jgi:hypothetical protein
MVLEAPALSQVRALGGLKHFLSSAHHSNETVCGVEARLGALAQPHRRADLRVAQVSPGHPQ